MRLEWLSSEHQRSVGFCLPSSGITSKYDLTQHFLCGFQGLNSNLDAGMANGVHSELSPQPLQMAFSDNPLLFNQCTHGIHMANMISLLAFVLVGGWLRDEILNHLKSLGAQEEW